MKDPASTRRGRSRMEAVVGVDANGVLVVVAVVVVVVEDHMALVVVALRIGWVAMYCWRYVCTAVLSSAMDAGLGSATRAMMPLMSFVCRNTTACEGASAATEPSSSRLSAR